MARLKYRWQAIHRLSAHRASKVIKERKNYYKLTACGSQGSEDMALQIHTNMTNKKILASFILPRSSRRIQSVFLITSWIFSIAHAHAHFIVRLPYYLGSKRFFQLIALCLLRLRSRKSGAHKMVFFVVI